MYQTVTSGPIQLPTSLEPWLKAKAQMEKCSNWIKYLSAPKQAVSSWRGLNTLFTSSTSSSSSSITIFSSSFSSSSSTTSCFSCLSHLSVERGRESLFWLFKKKTFAILSYIFHQDFFWYNKNIYEGEGTKTIAFPSEPNALIKRIDLLMASKEAVITGTRN